MVINLRGSGVSILTTTSSSPVEVVARVGNYIPLTGEGSLVINLMGSRVSTLMTASFCLAEVVVRVGPYVPSTGEGYLVINMRGGGVLILATTSFLTVEVVAGNFQLVTQPTWERVGCGGLSTPTSSSAGWGSP